MASILRCFVVVKWGLFKAYCFSSSSSFLGKWGLFKAYYFFEFSIFFFIWNVSCDWWELWNIIWPMFGFWSSGLDFGLALFLLFLLSPFARYSHIVSNFWKFYLIRISFILGELVSLVKVFRLFRLEQIVFGVQSVDTVGKCISYGLAGPACLWCLV